jgi:hypothetical protein
MRTDCRHYESRTYANGEVVRKCRIDLAPEAPWRCPENCPGFDKRRFDAGWQYGTLAPHEQVQPEPPAENVAALLDQAEEIINAVAPEVMAEFQKPKRKWGKRKKKRR